MPASATACNCTACRRYGVLWAYGHEGEGIDVSGETRAYVRADFLGFHFCPSCGCVVYWRALQPDARGRRRIGINLRMAEPELIAQVPVEHLDGLDGWNKVPRDTACIGDLWF
jgi:hypothetical protein